MLVVLDVSAWPERDAPLYYFDSTAYVEWPRYIEIDGVTVPRNRPPSYPLLLKATGLGAPLVHVQTWLSLGAWLALGFAVARTAGLALFGLLALAPAIRLWNLALLTESLTLSLLALVVALSLAVRDRPGVLRVVAWWIAIVAFARSRDAHLVLLPLASIAFLPPLGEIRSRPAWLRFGVSALLLAALLGLGFRAAEENERWRAPIYTAIVNHVAADPDALQRFRDAGMPRGMPHEMTPEMHAWLAETGRSLYLGWVLSRWDAWSKAWEQLSPERESDRLREEYFSKTRRLPRAALTPVADWLFRATSPPQWLWLIALALPFALARGWPDSPLPTIAWAAVALAGASYVLAFGAYWGAGTETLRHGLAATTLYRWSFVMALAASAMLVARLRAPLFGLEAARGLQ